MSITCLNLGIWQLVLILSPSCVREGVEYLMLKQLRGPVHTVTLLQRSGIYMSVAILAQAFWPELRPSSHALPWSRRWRWWARQRFARPGGRVAAPAVAR